MDFSYSRFIFAFFTSWFLFTELAVPSFAKPNAPSSIEAVPVLPTESHVTVTPMIQTSVAQPPQEARATQITTQFRRQWGLGLTVVPAYQLWFFPEIGGSFPFQGGLQVEVFYRIHPRFTLEFSLGGTGARGFGGSLIEIGPLFGFRFYPVPPKEDRNHFHLVPYAAISAHLLGRILMLDDTSTSYVGLGMLLGGGLEFRLNSHSNICVDVRGSLQLADVGTTSVQGLGGIRTAVSFMYYF